MIGSFSEATDMAVTLLYTVLSAGLFGTGLVTELRGFNSLGSGEMIVTAWLIGMGIVVCVAGLYLFNDVVRPRVKGA